jgi:hypothetical protein
MPMETREQHTEHIEILSSQVSRSDELTPLQLFTGTGACTSEAEKEPEKLIPWT